MMYRTEDMVTDTQFLYNCRPNTKIPTTYNQTIVQITHKQEMPSKISSKIRLNEHKKDKNFGGAHQRREQEQIRRKMGSKKQKRDLRNSPIYFYQKNTLINQWDIYIYIEELARTLKIWNII